MHKLNLPIFLLSFVYFLGIQNLSAHDQQDIASPQELPIAETLRVGPRVLKSALLQRHIERNRTKKEGDEEYPVDFSASKATYIGREARSPACSEQLTSTDEDPIPFEYSVPSASRPHVSFGESHTRKYKPGSGTLLGTEETVKKIDEACWDTFGDVVPAADSAAPVVPKLPVVPPLPLGEKAPEPREAFIPPCSSMAEIISILGDPAADFREAVSDIPCAPGPLPGVIAEEEQNAMGRKSATTTKSVAIQLSFPTKIASIGQKDMQNERKMKEEHDDNYESQCCGCIVC